MNLHPYQAKAIAEVHEAIARGERKIVLTSPTGGGKSLMAGTLLKDYFDAGKRAVIYTNKKLLTSQNADVFSDMGLDFGIRAAGHDTALGKRLQIASMPTEHSRANRSKVRLLHDADLVIVEEAHIQMGPTALAILKEHHDKGAAIVAITATPLGMGEFYETLVVAGTNSELRDCGMLVLASHYGPDEPDFKAMKQKEPDGENPGPAAQKKAIMTPTIFARVGQWYDMLNPEQKPSILFGPGVNESLWFAEKFTAKGIPAAHIDGEDCWIAGKFYESDDGARKAVADGSRDGSIKIVCNRYVLREGVNWPWIEHMILAYVVGSLQTYLQIGGRGLRASTKTGKTGLVVQDHGGAWHRHGSLNADRVWELGETSVRAAGLRADRLREKKDAEPWRCPGCARIMTGKVCPCGRVMPPKRSRPVVMADGELREMTGDIYRPRTIYKKPDGQAIWEKMYFRSKTGKGERTFRAAMALFARESMERGRGFCYPDPTWPFMPKCEKDRFHLVKDVPRERLY